MNPAERLLGIYDKFLQQPDNIHIGQAWAQTFSLNVELDFEDDLVTSLLALREHIQFVCNLLPTFGIGRDLAESGISKLMQFTSPTTIYNNCGETKRALIGSDTRVTLAWTSALLKSLNEEEASENEINEILEAIRLLEIDIIAIEMTPSLRHFIIAQIKSLKKSVLSARIKGAESLRHAVSSVTGEIMMNADSLKPELDNANDEVKGAFSTLGGIVKKVAEAGDVMDKVIKLGQNLDAGYTAVKPYLPFLG